MKKVRMDVGFSGIFFARTGRDRSRRWILPLATLLGTLCYTVASAQIQRIFHQTFPLDSVREVRLDLSGTLEVQPWAGNRILTETTVRVFDATRGVFDHAVAMGRYELAMDTLGAGSIALRQVDTERAPLQTAKGQSYEEVRLIIYLPEQFKETEPGLWSAGLAATRPPLPDSLPPPPGGGRDRRD